MSQLSLDQALQLAVQHHQAGQLRQAEEGYRQILSRMPNHPDALHLLGLLAGQAGQPDAGIELIQHAISVSPQQPVYHNNLGNLFARRERRDEALAAYRRALELKPDYASAYNNLGIVLKLSGRLDDAVAAYRAALRIQPDSADFLNNLGSALNEQGEFAAALPLLQRAVSLNPKMALAQFNLGVTYVELGQADEAVASMRRAVALQPEAPDLHDKLGVVLGRYGRMEEAIACFRQVVRLQPDDMNAGMNLAGALEGGGQYQEASACYQRLLDVHGENPIIYYNLGVVLEKLENVDAAIAAYRAVLRLNPGHAPAQNNLGNVLKDTGQVDEACSCYRVAAKEFAPSRSNLLYTLTFHPQYDAAAQYQELQKWNEAWAEPLRQRIQPHSNDRLPERPLRIGYVSGDFRDHVVGRNMYPLLGAHERALFNIYCYSNVRRPDAATDSFRAHADVWRDIQDLSDEATADLIRRDGIDLLVDLSLHLSLNRLAIFGQKPAPVQFTFAGYPGTTGLTTIDYRLTDPYLDPPSADTSFYSEKTLRLPDTFWCYDPLGTRVEISPLPAVSAGAVTFGCLNNFCKINDDVLRLWSQVLKAVPGSRIHLLSLPGAEIAHRRRVVDVFVREGISPERITFVYPRPRGEYLAFYHAVDISLDSFPYNGHTTSLDSLWMGVPVVTLVGKTVVGRAGLSQLSNLGLPELIAHTPEEYVQIVAALAADLPRLTALRATLRERMEKSPLMDATRFARGIEAAYRQAWREWCLAAEAAGT